MPSPIAPLEFSSTPTFLTPAQCKSLADAGTTAHRLGSGPDGWVERLGDVVNISYKNDAALDTLLDGLAAQSAASGWTPARVYKRFLPVKNADRIAPVLHSGDPSLPWTLDVTEGGVRYGIDLAAGYSHGLFLDQRRNRARLRTLRPRRVLNTFAHTCSFSVVAALGGTENGTARATATSATETLSVDLSRKWLDRGRQNFQLNNLPEKGHRFLAEDTLTLLPTLAARGEKFDAIILDPPTFSRGKDNRRWQVEHDLETLLNAALDLAMTRCAILISTNCTKLDPATLERRARRCARDKRLVATYEQVPPQVDFPPGHGSSTLWMMVK